MALLDNVYQRSNRFRLQEYFIQQHGIQYQSPSVHAKVYFNNENTGKSYNLRSIAENLDRDYKPDNNWYSDYTTAFNSATLSGASPPMRIRKRGRRRCRKILAWTAEFKNVQDHLATVNNWD